MPEEYINWNKTTVKGENGQAPLRAEERKRELRSDNFQEIVSHRPGFLVQWGNVIFLVLLFLIVGACWFIRYPDLIQAPAKLTSINAPKPVICLQPGKLVKLLVTQNEEVVKGQPIGYLESTADHLEILNLSGLLDLLDQQPDSSDLIKYDFEGNYKRLGELQPAFQTFAQSLITFRNYLPDGFYEKRKLLLDREKSNLEKLQATLLQQRELQEQDLNLTKKTFKANETLNKEKVISDFDYRLEQSKLISKQLSLPQINSAIINNNSQLTSKEREILDLQNSIDQQAGIFSQAIHTLTSQVSEWKRKYILTSAISGRVEFASFIQENQELKAGEVICFVNPGNSHYFAELEIPQVNFGKVEVGQNVLLKFSSYPFQEFGSVNGEIGFISTIAGEKGYLAKVNLTNGLITSNKKQIQYREGLTANAEIITKDTRLLERFYIGIYKTVAR